MRRERADGGVLILRWRRLRLGAGLLAWGLSILLPGSSGAGEVPAPPLGEIITAAAGWAGVAPELLASIVWVESRGWPWALNIRGQSVYPRNRAEAAWFLRRTGAQGTDIGYAQIHYPIWGPALGLTPEQLLDPWTNLHVGALVLRWAMAQESGWAGVGRYHSATPWRQQQYARAVATTWRALTSRLPPLRQ